jgi:hypothetical protein
MNRANPSRLLATTIAILTVLAVFVAPLCGNLCAAPRHCGAEVAAIQVDSDGCHHLTMADSAGAASAIVPAIGCAQPETIAIVGDETSPQSRSLSASLLTSTIASLVRFALRGSILLTGSGGRAPLTSTSVHATTLRI